MGLWVYRFIGLSVYEFIGLSVYRFIGYEKNNRYFFVACCTLVECL